ncbi:MAG: sialidase family protein [Armatimonadota bacterium]
MKHVIVAGEPGMFAGWPANNGMWSWDHGREILVGFTYGRFIEQAGHNIEGMGDTATGLHSRLARSTNGGLSWQVESPEHFVGDGVVATPSPGGFRFNCSSFAMRVVGTGYHGSNDTQGSFYTSVSRGRNWQGPYRFNGLMDDVQLQNMDITSRTEYMVTGEDSCLVFMSGRPRLNGGGRDKSFMAETTDGGRHFKFVAWIVPLSDPYRAVMPSVVQLPDGSLVAALRRRNPNDGEQSCWVDCYGSIDHGRSWSFLSRVGDTGGQNGNPPALALLDDGQIACAYGNRDLGRPLLRISTDGGVCWSEELGLRHDFQPDTHGDMDFGYPRLVQNERGDLVVIYYWATTENIHQHIAATIWSADDAK